MRKLKSSMTLHKKKQILPFKNGVEVRRFRAGITTPFHGLDDPGTFYLCSLPSLPCLLVIQIGCWSCSYHIHIEEGRRDGEQRSFPRCSTNNFCLYPTDTKLPGKCNFLAGHSITQKEKEHSISREERWNGHWVGNFEFLPHLHTHTPPNTHKTAMCHSHCIL